jgi:hypothetical protein
MAFAHSMLTALRHPACARQQRRLSGHGQPLTDTSYLSAPGPEARVSTSRRRSAKRKWQDAMFRVFTVHGQPLTDTSGFHKSPRRKPGELYSRKTRHLVVFAWPASAGWCCASHPAKPSWTSRGSAEARGAFGFFAPVGECAAAKRDGEKANATRLVLSPAVICHHRTLPHPHHSARFSRAKNRCQSGKTQGRIPREDRNFRLSGPDR